MPFTSSILNPSQRVAEGLSWSLSVIPYNNVTEGYSIFLRDGGGLDPVLFAKHNDTEIPLGSTMVLKVPFFYGVPIAIQGSLTATVFGQLGRNGGSFSAVVDASHSMYWEGISSVTDGAGNEVTGYTLTSDSGTDWSRNLAPVPEPTTMLLILAGLGALGLRRRGSLVPR
jgi:hypothetical protein